MHKILKISNTSFDDADVYKILYIFDKKFWIKSMCIKVFYTKMCNGFVQYGRSDVYHFYFELYLCVVVVCGTQR